MNSMINKAFVHTRDNSVCVCVLEPPPITVYCVQYSSLRHAPDNLQANASAADLPENLNGGCPQFLLSVMLAAAVPQISQIRGGLAQMLLEL